MNGHFKKKELVEKLESLLTNKTRRDSTVIPNDFLSDLLDSLNHSSLQLSTINDFHGDEIHFDDVDSEVDANFSPFDGFYFKEKNIPNKGDKVYVSGDILYSEEFVTPDNSFFISVSDWNLNKEDALLHFEYLDGNQNVSVYVNKNQIEII